MKEVVLIGIMGLHVTLVIAQQPLTKPEEAQQWIESLLEEMDPGEEAGEDMLLLLTELAEHPLNINRASRSELLQIPWIDQETANAIVEYRSVKPFEQLSELRNIKGIGPVLFSRIEWFLEVSPRQERFQDWYRKPEYWFRDTEWQWIGRYQQNLGTQEGYRRPDSLGGYLGSPIKYYQRLRFTSRHLLLNMTQKKDPGEVLRFPEGFDYSSYHVSLINNGRLRELIIGDFELQTGQGLVFGSGYGFGKSAQVTEGIIKPERGLKAYGSSQETQAFRGVAVQYGERFEWTGFYSNRKRTASLLDNGFVRFPDNSGYHRTYTELERRNRLRQTTTGGRIRWIHSYGQIGLTGYLNSFDKPIGREQVREDVYKFHGRSNNVIGADLELGWGSTRFAAELATSRPGGWAWTSGWDQDLGENTELALSFRNYQPDFHSFWGSGFGERGSPPQGERGFYMGMHHQLKKGISASAYMDSYILHETNLGTSYETHGLDVLINVEAVSARKDYFTILYKSEVRDALSVGLDGYSRSFFRTGKDRRSKLRLQTDIPLLPYLWSRSRLEWVSAKGPGSKEETGLLIYQDMRWKAGRKTMVSSRVALFETDGFDSRVYQYENDLLYVFRNTMLSGTGQRWYLLVHYKPSSKVEIWMKYGDTLYEDRQSLGTGLTEQEGNRRREVGVQMRIRFR